MDGYEAYNRLTKGAGANDGVTLAACFARVRRRFYELHVNSRLATQTITTMAALWKIKEAIRGKNPATRVKARQEKSATIVATLFELWETELPRLSRKLPGVWIDIIHFCGLQKRGEKRWSEQ